MSREETYPDGPPDPARSALTAGRLSNDFPRSLDAALAYAERGWRTFPIRAGAKTPAIPSAHPDGSGGCRGECGREGHGLHDATTDPATLTRWFDQEYPDAAIAIRTGAVSGLVVVDVDAGKDGYATIAKIEAAHANLITLEAGTGGGGAHLYFRHPGREVTNSAKHLRDRYGSGVDIRGDGGYVLAPPSGHPSGGRYQWCDDPVAELDPVELPEWFLELLAAPPRPVSAPVAMPTRPGRRAGSLERFWKTVLKRRLEHLDTITSNRNDELNAAAFRMGQIIAIGAPDDMIRDLLEQAGRMLSDRGDHPMTEREIQATVRSGLDGGRQHPDTTYRGEGATA